MDKSKYKVKFYKDSILEKTMYVSKRKYHQLIYETK